MDFDCLDLVVSDNIVQYREALEEVINENHAEKYTDVEKSDAFERLGIAQFYHGDYKEAVTNLEIAICPQFLEFKSARSIALVKSTVLCDLDALEAILCLNCVILFIVGASLLPIWTI